MGDSRAYVEIEFSIYGKTYKTSMSINWSADDWSGVDHRVSDWFRDCYEEAYGEFVSQVNEERMQESKVMLEKLEKEELKRLKEKYPDQG